MFSRTKFKFDRLLERLVFRLLPYCTRRRHVVFSIKNFFQRKNGAGHGKVPSRRYTLDFLVHLQNRALLSVYCDSSLLQADAPTLTVILIINGPIENGKLLEYIQNLKKSTEYEIEVLVACHSSESSKIQLDTGIARVFETGERNPIAAAINDAIMASKSKFVLFLSTDITPIGPSVELLIAELNRNQETDVVAGKIISFERKILSAGATLDNDHNITPIGLGKWFLDPEFSFRKRIDLCNEGFFVVRREAVLRCSCFDTNLKSFSYALADFCLKTQKAGRGLLLQPYAVGLSRQKWPDAPVAADRFMLSQRSGPPLSEGKGHSVLVIDHSIPDPALGSGTPRTLEILQALARKDYSVTFLSTEYSIDFFETVLRLQLCNVEMQYGNKRRGSLLLSRFLKRRKGTFGAVVVSRPFLMLSIGSVVRRYLEGTPIIYDAEAIYCVRTINFLRLSNTTWLSSELIDKLIREEVMLARKADAVITVSQSEANEFTKRGIGNVHILGHSVTCSLGNKSFTDRKNILFVGGINESPSPNEDAIMYFCSSILPLILTKIDLDFYIVGSNSSAKVWKLASERIKVIGRVEDLAVYYDSFRIFVAPTRYAAGVPLKVYEAASKGIPCVITPLLAGQLQWKNGDEALVGRNVRHFATQCIRLYTNEKLWNHVRQKSYGLISSEFNPATFAKKLSEIISSAFSPLRENNAPEERLAETSKRT